MFKNMLFISNKIIKEVFFLNYVQIDKKDNICFGGGVFIF